MNRWWRQIVWLALGAFALGWFLIGTLSNIVFLINIGFLAGSALVTLTLLIVIGFAWKISDDGLSPWQGIIQGAHRIAVRFNLIDPPVLIKGAIRHNGRLWICEYYQNQDSEISYQACSTCKNQLIDRHVAATDFDTEQDTPAGTVIDVLTCSYCGESYTGQEYDASGSEAVLRRFDTIVGEMQSSHFISSNAWQGRPNAVESTPADIWDQYARRSKSDDVVTHTVVSIDETDRRSVETYPKFAELKEQRDFREMIVDLLPEPLNKAGELFLRTDYLERKHELRQNRSKVLQKFSSLDEVMQNQHLSTLNALTEARRNRAWPNSDCDEEEMGKISEDIDNFTELRNECREYLTKTEYNTIIAFENKYRKAKEYYQTTTYLSRGLQEAKTTLEFAEANFEPFEKYDRYLNVSLKDDLEALQTKAADAVTSLQDRIDSASGPIPSEATETVLDFTHRVAHLEWALSNYEAKFRDNQVNTYPEVFQADGYSLNDEQKLAVIRDERHNLVDASAGTGKTLTLTSRFLYLYETGTPMEDIVAITFGSDAADEMQERVSEASSADARRFNISTIHSLARDVISRSINGNIDGEALEDGETEFLDRAFSNDTLFQELAPQAMDGFLKHRANLPDTDPDFFSHPEKSNAEVADELIEEVFQTARNFARTADELRSRTDRGDELEYQAVHAAAALLEVYEAYGESIDRPIDHNHSIELAIETIRQYPDRYEDEYDHVLVDEFQDVSERDIEFIKLLLGSEAHLFAVGDDWQSIYGFRGAKPAFFREFESRFGAASRTTLKTNYRSAPEIVAASSALMADSAEATEKEVAAAPVNEDTTCDHTPTLHQLHGPYTDRQGAYIADLIEDIADEEYENVLVLARNKKDVYNTITDHLQRRGISIDLQDDSNDDDNEGPEGVRIRTVHKSKGTQAKYVIVANAVDDKFGGMPPSSFDNRGKEPALDQTVDHFEEEQRVFYVAITRAEEELHIITQASDASRYTDSMQPYLNKITDKIECLQGVLTARNLTAISNNKPDLVTLDCGAYESKLKTWDTEVVADLETGEKYRFDNLKNDTSGFEEDMEITNHSTISALGTSSEPVQDAE